MRLLFVAGVLSLVEHLPQFRARPSQQILRCNREPGEHAAARLPWTARAALTRLEEVTAPTPDGARAPPRESDAERDTRGRACDRFAIVSNPHTGRFRDRGRSAAELLFARRVGEKSLVQGVPSSLLGPTKRGTQDSNLESPVLETDDHGLHETGASTTNLSNASGRAIYRRKLRSETASP